MKKFIVIFLIILCSCGIGYLGYLIFNSKNVDTVELVGNVQTLYVVGDEFDYEDAKLKVTYKNGNIKMINLNSKNVKISYFTTSVETHGKMAIKYKAEILELEYNVIQKGAYFVNYHETKSINSSLQLDAPDPETYDINTTEEMIYISEGGVLSYYTKLSNGNWSLADGRYDARYTYSITADTLTAKIKDKTYNLKAKYLESGDIVLETTNLTKIENTNLVTKEEKKVLKYTPEIKSTQTVNSISTCHNIDDLDINVVEFKKGENFDTDTHKFYLEVTYLQYSVDSQFRTVYVDISKDMVKTSYSTASAFSTPRTVNIAYEGNYAQLNYYVVN